MTTHSIDFYGELTKIILQLSANTHLICSTALYYSRLDHHFWLSTKYVIQRKYFQFEKTRMFLLGF